MSGRPGHCFLRLSGPPCAAYHCQKSIGQQPRPPGHPRQVPGLNSLPQTQGTVANPLTSLPPHASSLPVRWRVHTPIIVDTHSGALLGTAAVTVGAGGAFMLVTGLEPSKTHSIWMNASFDTGLALVILGLAVARLGLYANFRKLRTGTSAADAAKPAQVPPTDKPRRPLPPLEVKILPNSGFERWGQSVRIAALHVEVKNTTGKDILVNDYEFSYDTQGRPTWEQQATDDERLASGRRSSDGTNVNNTVSRWGTSPGSTPTAESMVGCSRRSPATRRAGLLSALSP